MKESGKVVANVTGNIIFLVGLSGSGKTTVGKALSKKLGASFFDTDSLIAKESKLSIRSMFEKQGERKFRSIEHSLIRKSIDSASHLRRLVIIALGGGALISPETRRLVCSSGIIIYLSVSCAAAARRIAGNSERPLTLTAAGQPLGVSGLTARLRKLLRQRKEGYSIAHLRIRVTHLTPAQVSKEIQRMLAGLL